MTPHVAPVAAPSYFDHLYYLVGQRYVADLPDFEALAGAGPRSRILDLGGGFGRVAVALARQGHEITVVESSPEMLEMGAEHIRRLPAMMGDQIEWIQADIARPIEDLPLNWYRYGICAHHTVNQLLDDLDGLFANFAAHLQAGGIAAVSALPDALYDRPCIVEFLDSFTAQEADWIVTTTVVPVAGKPSFHRLFFFYEQYRAGHMIGKHARWTDRRVWTRAEITEAAARHNLVPSQSWTSKMLLLFEKVTT